MATQLICCAAPHGYGPASKLCRIAEQLRSREVQPIFLGTGSALELASRSDAFDEIIDAPADSRVASDSINSASALLSLMDRDYLPIAQRQGKATFVVDSLFWMRDRIPDSFLAANRYWIQDFFGVQDRMGEHRLPPTLVGPIVPPASPTRDLEHSGIAVHLGGCDSPLSAIDAESGYADFVLDALTASNLPARFPGPIVVMAGRRGIDALAPRHRSSSMELVSVPPDRAAELMNAAVIVLSAPGLTASLECFQVGRPTFFLPPQNYSQWWILNELRDHQLAPGAFHWQDHMTPSPVKQRMAESERVPLLRSIIGSQLREGAALKSLVASLDSYALCDPSKLGNVQQEFFNSLGVNGLVTIVNELAQFISQSAVNA